MGIEPRLLGMTVGSIFWPVTIFLPMSAVSSAWQPEHFSPFLVKERAPPWSVPVWIHSNDDWPGVNSTALASGALAQSMVLPAACAKPMPSISAQEATPRVVNRERVLIIL